MGLGPFWTDGTEDHQHPWAPLPGVRTGSQLSRGERAADLMRNKMGSWAFVGGFTAFMLVWAGLNSIVLTRHAFDPYPYILLNLLLSTLAGLQGAILLIAAKRADAIAAEQALSHLTISQTSSEIIRAVNRELSLNTKTTKEIHTLLNEIHTHLKEGNDD
jgi:uncharacterized membrane protein